MVKLSFDSCISNQSTNQKHFASGRIDAHIIKKSRSLNLLANQNYQICHVTAN